MSEKNSLVDQTVGQKDPYRAEGSDFPVKHVNARHGQSGEKGFSSGKNSLADAPHGSRYIEDGGEGSSGAGTPVGDRAKGVAAAFPVETNQGESSSGASKVSISESVSLSDGYISGGSQTRVKEVPESKVSIPSR